MYSSLISSILVSFLTAGNVCANSPAALVVPIHRSLHKNKNPASVHSSSLPVCDVSKIKEQRANIVNKYHDVQERLFSSSIDFNDVIPPISAEEAEEPFIPADYISDNLDMLYFGDVYIGKPTAETDVSTSIPGSADFWMPVNCSECVNKQFEDTRSSTCKDSGEYVSVCYGSGEVSGALMQDKVSVAGLEVESFFIAVSELDGDFNGLPNDGLMGFAFSSISESRKPTFFETLPPMFSVHLTRHQESGSSLCFGGIDNLKTLGPVQWIPVLKESYWSVSMDAIVVDENKEVTTDIIAIIDTGTTLIYLPDDVVSAFYELIPGARLSEIDSQLYIYPCITAPDINIALSFDNRRFSINPKDFNLGRTEEGSEDCVGGILSLGSGFPSDLAIIGDEFLKSWYTTFDYSGGPTGGARVGFSPSINNS
ncbi:aspartic peptidase domain-containing protein [Mycena filopes]|nr:aspartic peptidase domain-containing protein [Mycena filopes]